MKIAVLDKCTVTNGDVDLSSIEKMGEVEYYDILDESDLEKVLRDKDTVILNKAIISGELMKKLPNLKYIGLFATGYNNIDIKTAAELNITVCNVPGYSTDSVAQHVFSMILALACNTQAYNISVHNGDWTTCKKFSYLSYPITELANKTLGIFGYGNIGSAVAKIGLAFNMKVIACTRSAKSAENIEFVDFDTLLKRSDFLTLHTPLTEKTKYIINGDTIKLMKESAYIINTSRGAVVNEQDLCKALNCGQLAGAGIDTLEYEPMQKNNPYLTAKNCVITPHVAWGSIESRRRLIDIVCSNLKSFVDGTPVNTVK